MSLSKEIAQQLDALIAVQKKLTSIRDRLDDMYDRKSNPKIGRQLNAVQYSIDALQDAVRELMTT